MEYLELGGLDSFLRDPTKARGMTWHDKKMGMALDVIRGLRYLHGFKEPIIHRDIKGGNCLVAAGSYEGEYRVKISDLGESRHKNLKEDLETMVLSTAATDLAPSCADTFCFADARGHALVRRPRDLARRRQPSTIQREGRRQVLVQADAQTSHVH